MWVWGFGNQKWCKNLKSRVEDKWLDKTFVSVLTTSLSKFEQFWASLSKFEQVWAGLSTFEQVSARQSLYQPLLALSTVVLHYSFALFTRGTQDEVFSIAKTVSRLGMLETLCQGAWKTRWYLRFYHGIIVMRWLGSVQHYVTSNTNVQIDIKKNPKVPLVYKCNYILRGHSVGNAIWFSFRMNWN